MKESAIKITLLDTKAIKYQINLTKTKNFRMHFNNNGILMINYPLGAKFDSLNNFINKNISWIEEKNHYIKEKMISYDNNSTQLFLGEKYTILINYSKTTRLDVIDKKILISTSEASFVRELILKWRFEKAQIIFEEMLYYCFQKMADELATFPKLIIKTSKTKWGCCYFNENKIMLNVALTQVPPYLIEYVICHELTHFIVHNHSKAFHDTLEKYVNNERIKMRELKKYTSIL